MLSLVRRRQGSSSGGFAVPHETHAVKTSHNRVGPYRLCLELASGGMASVFLARRETEHVSGLGRYRWVVERTFAWLHQFKRLLVRYERRADIHEAFLAIGYSLICLKLLQAGATF